MIYNYRLKLRGCHTDLSAQFELPKQFLIIVRNGIFRRIIHLNIPFFISYSLFQIVNFITFFQAYFYNLIFYNLSFQQFKRLIKLIINSFLSSLSIELDHDIRIYARSMDVDSIWCIVLTYSKLNSCSIAKRNYPLNDSFTKGCSSNKY